MHKYCLHAHVYTYVRSYVLQQMFVYKHLCMHIVTSRSYVCMYIVKSTSTKFSDHLQIKHTVFYQLTAVPQIVATLGYLSRNSTLKIINLCFMCNFDIKIFVSRHTYFYLKFIVAAAINQ